MSQSESRCQKKKKRKKRNTICCRDRRNDDHILKAMITHSGMCGCTEYTLRAQTCGMPVSSHNCWLPGGRGGFSGIDLRDRRAQVSFLLSHNGEVEDSYVTQSSRSWTQKHKCQQTERRSCFWDRVNSNLFIPVSALLVSVKVLFKFTQEMYKRKKKVAHF